MSEDSDGVKKCLFNGVITAEDATQFIRDDVASGCETVVLNSPGGDIEAAMRMGRVVRSRQLAAVVTSQMSCASACFLVYAAGVTRMNWGPIYIHRPYSAQASAETFEQTQARFAQLKGRFGATFEK